MTRARGRETLGAVLCALAVLLTGCTVTVDGYAVKADADSTSGPTTGSTGNAAIETVDPLAPVPEHPAEPIDWYDCTDLIAPQLAGEDGAQRDLVFECGLQNVPADYADPTADSLEIFMVRASVGSSDDKLPLVVNPGGPGGSGANLAIGLALELPMDLLDEFAIVGFDPRGVGESSPLSCLSNAQRDENAETTQNPQTDEEIQQLVDGVATLIAGCEEYEHLEHLNTVETARDMDQLRDALGVDQLSYLGYSYGTQLGAVYATLFPERVRAFVLDGAVDMSISDEAGDDSQVAGFELAFERFADWCSDDPGCPIGDDPFGLVQQALAETKDDPLPSLTDDRMATDGITMTAVYSALYDEGSWPDLADAIDAALDGNDPTGLFELADAYNGRYSDGNSVFWSNLLDANIAINCNDTTSGMSIEEAKQLSDELGEQYPMFGSSFAWGSYTCSQWPTVRHPLPEVDASSAAPILVVGTVNDPATPYSGAEAMTEQLGGDSVLLTYDGDGHTAYPSTDCVNDAVQDYLINLTLPQEGTVCPA